MIITICCSLQFMDQALNLSERLKSNKHEVWLPETIIEAKEKGIVDIKSWLSQLSDDQFLPLKQERMRLHFDKISKSDAILVLNLDKKGVPNYVGANTLLEMGLAFWLKKPIFLYNPIPEELDYAEEIKGMNPIVLNASLEQIKSVFALLQLSEKTSWIRNG